MTEAGHPEGEPPARGRIGRPSASYDQIMFKSWSKHGQNYGQNYGRHPKAQPQVFDHGMVDGPLSAE